LKMRSIVTGDCTSHAVTLKLTDLRQKSYTAAALKDIIHQKLDLERGKNSRNTKLKVWAR